jgi:hypothetical protein
MRRGIGPCVDQLIIAATIAQRALCLIAMR